MKNFFKKIKSYIDNTAWIQPLLIVVVIFLLLFLLNPITTGIKSLINSIQTSSNMETITYGEYVDLISKDYDASSEEKYIFVFTAKDCENCSVLYPEMNEYLKDNRKYSYKTDYSIYNVNLSTKEKNDVDYYKDKTLKCEVTGKSGDYVSMLDDRIEAWLNLVGDYNTGTMSKLDESTDKHYSYMSTPIILWYVNGVEVKANNGYTSQSDFDSFISFPTKPFEDDGIQAWVDEINSDNYALDYKK